MGAVILYEGEQIGIDLIRIGSLFSDGRRQGEHTRNARSGHAELTRWSDDFTASITHT